MKLKLAKVLNLLWKYQLKLGIKLIIFGFISVAYAQDRNIKLYVYIGNNPNISNVQTYSTSQAPKKKVQEFIVQDGQSLKVENIETHRIIDFAEGAKYQKIEPAQKNQSSLPPPDPAVPPVVPTDLGSYYVYENGILVEKKESTTKTIRGIETTITKELKDGATTTVTTKYDAAGDIKDQKTVINREVSDKQQQEEAKGLEEKYKTGSVVYKDVDLLDGLYINAKINSNESVIIDLTKITSTLQKGSDQVIKDSFSSSINVNSGQWTLLMGSSDLDNEQKYTTDFEEKINKIWVKAVILP